MTSYDLLTLRLHAFECHGIEMLTNYWIVMGSDILCYLLSRVLHAPRDYGGLRRAKKIKVKAQRGEKEILPH